MHTIVMSYSGCSGAVQLGCLQEVEQVEINMEKQKVYLTSSLFGDKLKITIKKTGWNALMWELNNDIK